MLAKGYDGSKMLDILLVVMVCSARADIKHTQHCYQIQACLYLQGLTAA